MTKKPYAMVGAGPLVASVWKHGHEDAGGNYRFNVFRMDNSDGDVSKLFHVADLPDLFKLCRVLAAELVSDGCLPPYERQRLSEIVQALDAITAAERDDRPTPEVPWSATPPADSL